MPLNRTIPFAQCPHRLCVAPRQGVTLIEVLVVLGVIAVLVGIMLPVLGSAKWKVDDAALMAHQSQVFKVLDQYAADNQNRFPAWGQDGSSHAPLVIDGHPVAAHWWEQPILWGAFVQSKGYEGRASAVAGAGPMRGLDSVILYNPPNGFLSIHQMTHTAYASPVHFTRGRQPGVDDHQVQRMSSIAYPSLKGVLVQFLGMPGRRDVINEDSAFPVAFGDGHCEVPKFATLNPGVDVQHANWPVMATEQGILGRDK